MNVPIEEAAGVGVVKKSKDPRYVMSTSKDVKANILQKEMKAMKLAETAIVQFHDKLNPKFWEHGKLKTEVAEHLKAIAAYFINDVNVEDLDILDITISGSNAAYTYTPKSDLDLHIIVHVDKDNADLLQNFFNTKRSLFNKNHNISLHGAPVELYIQMDTEEHTSSGLYSLLKNKWLDIPKKVKATIEDTTVKAKYARIVKRIKKVIEDNDLDSANLLTKKIFNYRQAGLDKHGEFGVENLTFKMLRKNEWIDKLIDFKTKFVDKKLSIKPE